MPRSASMFSDLKYRLRAILRRGAMEKELAAELQFHCERMAAKLVAAGVPPDEALRRARLSIGGVEQVKEECREARGTAAFESTLQDVQYGLRQLRRRPGFALVVVASLALGIGANTAIFSLIDAVLLRMLPIDDPAGLHLLVPRQTNGNTRGFEYPEYRRLSALDSALAGVAAVGSTRLNVRIDPGGGIEPTPEGQLVSGSYFQLLGVRAIAGRTIEPADDVTPNGHPVAVISHGYWQRRFGLEPSVVGRTIHLSGTAFTIVGVAPRDFFGLEVGRAPDIWVPLMMQPAVMPAAENWLGEHMSRTFWLTLVGRVKPEYTPQQAASILAGLDMLDPLMTKPARPGEQPQVIPEQLSLSSAATGISNLRQQFSQPLLILMAVVSLLLLIACANVANLVLSRSAARLPEFSMRLALGAGRWRLVRQLLVENVILAALGGLVGFLLARWATALLVTFMSSGTTPIALSLEPDVRILTFTALVAVLTGVLCGLVPALRASRIDVVSGIKGQARGSLGGSQWLRPGKILVVSQVVLCLLLLFGAGLFVRSLQALDGQDDGFARGQVLVVRVEPKGSDQRGVEGASQRLDQTYRDLLQRVSSIPGVRAASLAHYGPTSRVVYSSPVGLPDGSQPRIPQMMVYPNYFAAMDIAVRAGRDFSERDLDDAAPLVGVVNQAFVRQVMNGESPIGQRILVDQGSRVREIIGVVEDSRYASLKEDSPPLIYQPFLQTRTGRGQMTLHVRIAEQTTGVVNAVRAEVQRIDKDMPIFAIQTLADQMNGLLSRERLVAGLSSLFGVVALVLAAVGLYGLMAFAVVQRTGEMALRMALGAARETVVRMVLRDALLLVGLGLVIGVPAAIMAGRLASSQLSGLLFGFSTTDPVTLTGAALLLISVAAVAAYLPAVRAARVDPMIALRND
jgi:predicted permease